MRTTVLLACVVVVGVLAPQARAQGKAKPAAPAPAPAASAPAAPLQTDDEKTIYSLGYSLGRELVVYSLSPAEMEIIKRGMADGNAGTPPAVDMRQYTAKVGGLALGRLNKANDAYLQKAAQEKGAEKLPSGIIYKELKAGTGPSPKLTDTVAVNYRGTLTSGEEFDSSYKRNQVAEFPLNGVIQCWTQGLQKMKVGGKAKLVCPPKLAYGDRPPPGSKITPNAVLEFEVELMNIPGDTSKH
jgi:FKBP-type peptidyl-prolyl cis-trans isomerase FkpA